MARPVWTNILANSSIQRSSQTLSVVAGNAYIYGGELRPREPVDSAVYRVGFDRGKDTSHRLIARERRKKIALLM
jgi:hypothetical protein